MGPPVWYVVVIGNVAFINYRHRITENRKRALDRHEQTGKIESDTFVSSENISCLIISAFSLVAVAIGPARVHF